MDTGNSSSADEQPVEEGGSNQIYVYLIILLAITIFILTVLYSFAFAYFVGQAARMKNRTNDIRN